MNKVIIVGSGNNCNELGLVRNFGVNGIKPYGILFCNENLWKHEWVHRSKYWKKCDRVDNPEQAIEFLISKYGNEEEKPVVITPVDYIMQMIDANYDELSKHFLLQSFNNKQNGINKLANKLSQYEFTKELGFKMLDTYLIDFDNYLVEDYYNKLPLLLKPVQGGEGRKDDITVCKTKDELDYAIKKFSENGYTRVLAQKYLENRKEILSYGSINKNANLISFVVSGKIRQWPNVYGVGSYYQTIIQPSIIEKIKNVYSALSNSGYDGTIDVEFFIDESNEIYVNEYNWRASGGNYTSLGVKDLSLLLWYYAKIGKPFNDIKQINEKEIFIINEISDFKHVLIKDISFKQWLLDLKRAKAFSIWYKKDLRPVWIPYLYSIKELLKRN